MDRLNHLVFNPFIFNYKFAGNSDLDPDINFFNNHDHRSYDYLLSDQFANKFRGDDNPHSFSCLHFNSRSLLKNCDSIFEFIELLNFQFGVIGFSETWLNDESPTSLLNIPDYINVFKNRQGRTGGGVAMYIHNSFTFINRPDLEIDTAYCDSIFIEIPQVNGKNIVTGVVYKPPDVSVNRFGESFDNLLGKLNMENKHVFLMGDLNIDLLKHNVHNPTSHFVDCLFSNSFFPSIYKPTRITDSTATLIDNIITNCCDFPSKSGILFSALLDPSAPVFISTASIVPVFIPTASNEVIEVSNPTVES